MARSGAALCILIVLGVPHATAGGQLNDDGALRLACADGDYGSCLALGSRYGCFEVVHAYATGRRAHRDQAAAAITCEQAACGAGVAIACRDLAVWTAEGIENLVKPDLAEARRFARRACDLGGDCRVLETLSYPPPTAVEQDDIREAVFRSEIPGDRPRNVTTQSPIYCLAFGTDADSTGQDPPPAFMARFRDIEDLKPRSWCVANRTGNRISLGPVDGTPRPSSSGRTARVWRLLQYHDGSGATGMVHAVQENGLWVVSPHAESGPSTAPPFPKADPSHVAEDRHRIAAVAAAFAEAWNGGNFAAMARLQGRVVGENLQRQLSGNIEHTRLEAVPEEIAFSETSRLSASARLRLGGRWTRAAGPIAPLDPWKYDGAVTFVSLGLMKETSRWEPGDWRIYSVVPPWEPPLRIVE